MSTKEIREVLHRAGQEFGGEVVQAALREVEDIEQAAGVMDKVMAGDTHMVKPAKLLDKAWETMAAIARQKGSK